MSSGQAVLQLEELAGSCNCSRDIGLQLSIHTCDTLPCFFVCKNERHHHMVASLSGDTSWFFDAWSLSELRSFTRETTGCKAGRTSEACEIKAEGENRIRAARGHGGPRAWVSGCCRRQVERLRKTAPQWDGMDHRLDDRSPGNGVLF